MMQELHCMRYYRMVLLIIEELHQMVFLAIYLPVRYYRERYYRKFMVSGALERCEATGIYR